MTGQIIQMGGDPHREVLGLLPWHVTGQLDAADSARVEMHLQGCAECRAALQMERRLDREIVRAPASAEQGWAAMRQRLDLDSPAAVAAPRHAPATAAPLRTATTNALPARFRWPAWQIGWRIGPPVVLAALAALLMLPNSTPASFKVLGSAPSPASGNIVVIFRPDTSEAVFRATLNGNNARLVDGPTAANAYVVRVPAASRAALVERLRREPQIVLAEPVDMDRRP